MPDNELIIRLLKAVERRIRGNRVLHETAAVLSMALAAPLVLKLADLIWPLRFITIAVFFAVWAVATAAWVVWRTRGRDTLQGVAADIDRKAGANDELRTAFW